MNKKPKILFIHNKVMYYTLPFFKRVSELYDVDFLFTHENRIEGLNGARYEILKNYFGMAFDLIPKLLKKDYDIVINAESTGIAGPIEMLICFIIAKLRKKVQILWSEKFSPPQKTLKFHLISLFYRLIVPHSDACLVQAIRHKEYMISLGALPKNVFIIPSSHTLIGKKDSYGEKEIIEQLGLNNKKVILYVGRLMEPKGVHYLIPAFAKLMKEIDNVALVIVGDGIYKGKLQKICREYSIEDDVRFVGWIENKNLPPYYSSCNIFVASSIVLPPMFKGGGDAGPLTVIEAASFGKPVIVTDACGLAYSVVQNGINGFVVPQKNVDALYEAIKTIISDPELEMKMGMESRRIAEEGFTYENMVNGFRKAVDHVSKKANEND